jgi:hypothetical protein
MLKIIIFLLLLIAVPANATIEGVATPEVEGLTSYECEGQAHGGASACTGTAGTDVGSTEYNVANVNYAYLMEVTVSSGCQADTGDEICAVIKNYDQSTYEFTFMVYDSDGGSGEPGTLLDSMAVSSSNSGSLDTVCENLTQSITFDNSTAWVGWIGENTGSSYQAAATGGTKRRHMDLTSQTAPSTWNTSGDSEDDNGRDLDVYITFN